MKYIIGIMALLLLMSCSTDRVLEDWESFAENNWDGFISEGSDTVSLGWCVYGDFKGQDAATWIVPHSGDYLIKRQYLAQQTCDTADLDNILQVEL